MYFPNAFKKVYVAAVNTGAIDLKTTGSTPALTAGQIGLYDAKTYTAISAAGAAGTNQNFILVQGSYYSNDKIGPFHGGYKESIKSKVINPKYVSRFFKVVAKTPLNQIISIGWNQAVGSSTGPAFVCGKTYDLRLDIKGSHALSFLNHQIYKTLSAFTGCCADDCNASCTGDPVDAASVLLQYKDQINNDPFLKSFVIAQVYTKNLTSLAAPASPSATKVAGGSLTAGSYFYKITAINANGETLPSTEVTATTETTNLRINLAWTAVTGATSYRIYRGTSSGAENMYFTSSTNSYSDISATAGTTAVVPTVGTASQGDPVEVSTDTYVPVTGDTADNVVASLQITVAYVDTIFGNCTFTVTDRYDLEPLFVYASIVDETGNPCAVRNIANSSTGAMVTELQTPRQASGVGETVLRDLILSESYLQNYFPDGNNVDQLRLREVIGDPSLSTVSRSGLYDQVCILHNVPRLYNPSSTFDNDQYLLVVNVPTGTTTTAFTNLVQAILDVAGNGVTLETF